MKSNSLFDLFQSSSSDNENPTPPIYLHNDHGNDFKKLLHKNRKARVTPKESSLMDRMTTSATTQSLVNYKRPAPTAASVGNKKTYHSSSPDFKPVILLNQTATEQGVETGGFLSSVYNYLFQHEDRYFNQSRTELSKDIFPVGYQRQ